MCSAECKRQRTCQYSQRWRDRNPEKSDALIRRGNERVKAARRARGIAARKPRVSQADKRARLAMIRQAAERMKAEG